MRAREVMPSSERYFAPFRCVTWVTLFKIFWKPDLERLIRCTALNLHLRPRRSAHRFEQDSYHGDALPTELTGPVFSCLTWGYAVCRQTLGRAQRWSSVDLSIGRDRLTHQRRRVYRTPDVEAPASGCVRPAAPDHGATLTMPDANGTVRFPDNGGCAN